MFLDLIEEPKKRMFTDTGNRTPRFGVKSRQVSHYPISVNEGAIFGLGHPRSATKIYGFGLPAKDDPPCRSTIGCASTPHRPENKPRT